MQQGWNDAEINRAQAILNDTQPHDIYLSKIVFWSALIVIIFANLLVSLVLIPFITVFKSWMLYSIVILLAGTIGFLYNFLITDIGHLERHHHVLASIIVPLIALLNVILTVTISNNIITELKINNSQHNPWLLSIVFVIAFILPYLFDQMKTNYHASRAVVIK